MTENATYWDKHVSSQKCIFFVVVTPAAGLVVLPQYELVPNPEFVSYYYQLLVRYTCIARMRFWWFVHYASTFGVF